MEIDNMSGSTPSDNLRDETSSLENVEPTLFSHPTILSRIEEYRTDSLLKPHNLQACLGATTAGLLTIGHYIELRIILRTRNCSRRRRSYSTNYAYFGDASSIDATD